MSKWIAEFDLEDGDTMPEHMDLEYKGARIDFHCRPLEQEPFINKPCVSSGVCEHDKQKVLDKIRAEILEERECAYADFERYKVEYLGQDWEDALDSLPQDDFRYGMERAIELIDKYRAESEPQESEDNNGKID